jgi:RNA polymerase sigma factor (sigma-70 family)
MHLEDERRIIEQARTNPEAFGIIFDKYYPKILAYTIRRTGSVVIAEEIVSETFTKAVRHLPKFRWQGVSIEAWLFRIVINEMRMYFRSNSPVSSLEDLYQREGFEAQADYDLAEEASEAQEQLERHEQFIRARKLLAKLPSKYQDVLLLRFIEQKKVEEIAHILGKKEGTVKSLLSRGLARLRAELAKKPLQPAKSKRIIKGKRRDDPRRQT